MYLACACALLVGVFGGTTQAQQAPTTRVFHMRETAGIRRTEYPVSVTFQLPKGALSDATHARMMTNSAEVAAQFTARASWEDGSVQALDVDFNATPRSRGRPTVRAAVRAVVSAPPRRPRAGSTAEVQPDAIVVGNLKFSKSGSPLLASATYRGEGHRKGANGLTSPTPPASDTISRRRRERSSRSSRSGPLLVVLQIHRDHPD